MQQDEKNKEKIDKLMTAVQKIVDAVKGLDASDRGRAFNAAAELLNIESGSSSLKGALGDVSKENDNGLDVKGFVRKKRPKTDIERVACLAFYLNKYRGVKKFKTGDITQLNTEAAEPKFSNPTVAVDNACNIAQYISQAGSGFKQISSRGEALVEALPDRDKVKEILKNQPLRKRGKRKAKNKKRSNKT